MSITVQERRAAYQEELSEVVFMCVCAVCPFSRVRTHLGLRRLSLSLSLSPSLPSFLSLSLFVFLALSLSRSRSLSLFERHSSS